MSTRASLPHLAPGIDASGQAVQSAFAWREELNTRLREHRMRREPQQEPAAAPSRPASGVAARVAQRYSSAPSYSDLLTASAAAADAAGSAAAAALEAHAAARAVLSEWDAQAERMGVPGREAACADAAPDVFDDPFFTEAARPRWEETATLPETVEPEAERLAYAAGAVAHHAPLPARTPAPERPAVTTRARALVDAFAEAVVPAAVQLPAKLIEFPRELIAAHKQRPRLAEGPLAEPPAETPSLRIFEVESPRAGDSIIDGAYRPGYLPGMLHPDLTMSRGDEPSDDERTPRRRGSFEPAAEPEATQPPAARTARPTPAPRSSLAEDAAPLWRGRQPEPRSGWSSIRLGEHPQISPEIAETLSQDATASENRTAAPGARRVQATHLEGVASLGDRALAGLMDASLVFASFLLALLVFASCTTHMPSGKGALAVGLLAFGAMSVFYGWLFMSYGGGNTPGMRYARIAVCTFDDANPSRKELQNRVPATALALLPLGLGLIWALMDEDRLGWHDRMTRTYQRSYR